MSNLKQLQDAETIQDLAKILGYKSNRLAYILYKYPEESKYTVFSIPKKNGALRVINAPNKRLKLLQRRLANLLYSCIEETKPKHEKLNRTTEDKPTRTRAKKSVSHGFQQGLSIATNAEKHVNKKYVYNIDIENFFPSINFGRVRGFFIKNNRFRLKPNVATIIAQIACHNNSLPQGSPCSPVISNLIAEIMDSHLVRLAKKTGCTYTRYADDLTFSTNLSRFPKTIACKKLFKSNEWKTGKELTKLIQYSGFSVNSHKSNMQFFDSRQTVTGLTVNRLVNTKSEYYRYTRAMCHSLFTKGYFTYPEYIKKVNNSPKKSLLIRLRGIFVSNNVINSLFKKQSSEADVPEQTEKILSSNTLLQIEGMLSHIYYIKSYRNKYAQPGYRLSRHDGNQKPKQDHENHNYPPFNRCNQYSDESHLVAIDGIKNLYAKFLFFKHFYFLDNPLIFCEGKTDNVYIKCALKQLMGLYPDLIDTSGKASEFKINFFNRTPLINEMLKLAEGASGMKFIIQGYKRKMQKFKCEGKKHPVIMIVDNDNGGRDVLKHCKNFVSGTKISTAHHVVENLYLIELPLVPGTTDTAMENYFDATVLSSKLGGKSFNPDNNSIDEKTEYGKNHFANHVVKKNQSTINFDRFKPLLNEITAVIKAHPVS